ncbi:MAG: hypothetical protein M3Y82_09585 [Verrucomicrobiota bacterium]|nr:hypothetical protein [Verrucomicrobiota bacterium]
MATVTYPLKLDESTYQRIEMEAKRRKKSIADIARDTIALGLPLLPPMADLVMDDIVADCWEKLGPAPEIDYDKL